MEEEKGLIRKYKRQQRFVQFVFMMFVALSISMQVTAQNNRRIKGSVISGTDGMPLIGVNVVQKGTTNGTVTDLDGNFELTAPENCLLEVSYIGYMNQQIKIQSGKTDYQIVLKEDSQALDEVVVVGYGVQKKKLVTGATVQVKGDDIQRLNTVSALGALQSQTPGVNITQTSGMPGEGFKVTIRGLGTTGSSAPLYIIDGVTGGDINNLNPADIESIDVLKDAASAAIYGSRAANGVILVTTKQGRVGKATISYDGYIGFQNVYKMAPLLNAQEYSTIMNESRMNDGLPAYDFAALVPDWDKIQSGKWNGTNWQEEIRNKNALTQNHALNITGGTEQSIYSAGISYTTQDGILGKPVAPKYDRYTFRLNTEHTLFKRNNLDIIKFGENLIFTYKENSGIGIGNIHWNDIHSMMVASPFLPMNDENGDYHYSIPWNVYEANPVAVMEYGRGQNITKNKNLRANAYLEIQPIKGLKFRSNFGLNSYTSSYRSFTPEYDLSMNTFNKENKVSQNLSTGTDWTWENTLNYSFNVAKQHNIDVLVGQSVEKRGMGEEMNGSNVNSIFSDLYHAYLDNTTIITPGKTTLGGSPLRKLGIVSVFGRVNYNYKETYLATIVMRADASSNFAKGNRWGYFPSVSAGWVLSNEAFMESTKNWLDFLKVRASWGQNGNADIDPFQYLATISFSNSQYFFGSNKDIPVSGAYPDILPNKDVTWETSEQLDLGVDARLLNGRMGISFDWYNKATKDWLVQAPILDTYGANAPFVNGGDVRNRGFEIALNWNDQVGDFTYGANLNISRNKNEVTKIANTEGIIHGDPYVLSNGAPEMYRAQVGYPIGYFYGYKTLGVFQNETEINAYQGAKLAGTAPGDLIFQDTNGDGSITEDDRCMIGDPNPDINLGLSLNFGYKGFDLAITANGVFGNQIAKSYRSAGDSPLENYTTDIFERWHGEGTSNRLPRLTSGTHTNWQYISDIYIENGDYLRLQNITLGYDFKKLFTKLPLQQARLYVTAQNLFTITGYSGMDPEVGHSGEDNSQWSSGIDVGFYPAPRTYMVGVNLKF